MDVIDRRQVPSGDDEMAPDGDGGLKLKEKATLVDKGLPFCPKSSRGEGKELPVLSSLNYHESGLWYTSQWSWLMR